MPAPTLIDGIACYAPEVAEAYDHYPSAGFDVTSRLEEESFWCRSRARLVARLVKRHAPPDASMLEIGCGTGTILRELARHGRFRLTGSEIYLGGLRHALRSSSGIEYLQLDATRMPFEEEFDVVGAFDVLEHIEDDEAVLRNVWRALRPGGHLLVTVPRFRFLWSRLDEIVGHKRRYERSELIAKIRGAGFELVYLSSFVVTLFPLMLLRRLLPSHRATASGGCGQEFEAHVAFPPLVNRIFDAVMRIDETLIAARVPLPVGGSLVAVARRPPVVTGA